MPCVIDRACILLLAVSPLFSGPAPASNRRADWRDDLQVFASKFPSRQKDFAKLYEPGFRREIASLRDHIAQLSDVEIVMRLSRLVASAGVAHNSAAVIDSELPVGNPFRPRLPLTFLWLSDGLAIVGASSEYANAVGTLVVKFGDVTPEEALLKVAPYVSHESEGYLRVASSGFLRSPAVLSYLKITDPDGVLRLTVAKPGGEPFVVTVRPADPDVKQTFWDEAPEVTPPLFLSQARNESDNYWFRYLGESQTLYIHYHICANDRDRPFADFSRDVLSASDAHAVRRVVIDLRVNSGGNTGILEPLKIGLKARLTRLGKVYVLISPMTFSSAMMEAVALRYDLSATLVGETAGERLNTYAVSTEFTLPYSQVHVHFSIAYLHVLKDIAKTRRLAIPAAAAGGSTGFLEPDLRVPMTFGDWLTGRDAAMEAVLAR
jgi:hypothetical protein